MTRAKEAAEVMVVVAEGKHERVRLSSTVASLGIGSEAECVSSECAILNFHSPTLFFGRDSCAEARRPKCTFPKRHTPGFQRHQKTVRWLQRRPCLKMYLQYLARPRVLTASLMFCFSSFCQDEAQLGVSRCPHDNEISGQGQHAVTYDETRDSFELGMRGVDCNKNKMEKGTSRSELRLKL